MVGEYDGTDSFEMIDIELADDKDTDPAVGQLLPLSPWSLLSIVAHRIHLQMLPDMRHT